VKNIGAAMNGGNGKREKGDEFFPTAEGTTRALIPTLREIGWPNDGERLRSRSYLEAALGCGLQRLLV
jgi:hypothetical protein